MANRSDGAWSRRAASAAPELPPITLADAADRQRAEAPAPLPPAQRKLVDSERFLQRSASPIRTNQASTISRGASFSDTRRTGTKPSVGQAHRSPMRQIGHSTPADKESSGAHRLQQGRRQLHARSSPQLPSAQVSCQSGACGCCGSHDYHLVACSLYAQHAKQQLRSTRPARRTFLFTCTCNKGLHLA